MAESADPDLPRGIALAWGIAAHPQRGPKREMSVERIVEAAIAIADAEGLGAVSMAAVAARLGYTPMSLYRYVSAKDDLILLMLEEATGLPSDEVRTIANWREGMELLYHEMLQRYLQHPWMLDVPINGTATTPSTAAWMDAGLHALAGTGLTPLEKISIVLLVTGHARWAGTVEAGYTRLQRDAGLSDDELAARENALFQLLVTADAYPDLRNAVDSGVFLDQGDPFGLGLARCLDGIDSYIAAVETGRRDEPRPWSGLEDAEIADDRRFREAQKAVRAAERALREARKLERQAAREARERLARNRSEN
ncbi:MAG: TetR/AcrR family transcriptional regulator C-terminal domain-containing protein [Propionicimonas sp.]